MTVTIATLAREGGVGVETVRYYQRRGLLRTPEKSGGSALSGGIRRYGDEDVRRLAPHVDAVVVGSAVVEAAQEAGAPAVRALVTQLRAATGR